MGFDLRPRVHSVSGSLTFHTSGPSGCQGVHRMNKYPDTPRLSQSRWDTCSRLTEPVGGRKKAIRACFCCSLTGRLLLFLFYLVFFQTTVESAQDQNAAKLQLGSHQVVKSFLWSDSSVTSGTERDKLFISAWTRQSAGTKKKKKEGNWEDFNKLSKQEAVKLPFSLSVSLTEETNGINVGCRWQTADTCTAPLPLVIWIICTVVSQRINYLQHLSAHAGSSRLWQTLCDSCVYSATPRLPNLIYHI